MSKAIDTGNNTDNGVNRTWTIRKDGEVLRRTVFDSQNQPLDDQICGENPQRIVREYDDEGRVRDYKVYIDCDDCEKLLLHQSFKYDGRGNIIEAFAESKEDAYFDSYEICEHLYFSYSEKCGKIIQHIFGENKEPIDADDVIMLQEALIYSHEMNPIPTLSAKITLEEAFKRIELELKDSVECHLFEISTPSVVCQITSEFSEGVLWVTASYGFNGRYLGKSTLDGLFQNKYLWPIESNVCFAQMDDLIKIEKGQLILYEFWL